MPTTPQEGKDPFFPRSLHPYASVVPKTKSAAPYVPQVVDLRLGGISGTGDHRLAIINGQTLELGEEGEVRSGTGRVRIRVIDIKTDTVVVQVGAQQLVLRLRPGL